MSVASVSSKEKHMVESKFGAVRFPMPGIDHGSAVAVAASCRPTFQAVD
jgi:hypothetical protein